MTAGKIEGTAVPVPVPSITVRQATKDDLAAVALLGKRFHQYTAWANKVPYSVEGGIAWANLMLDAGLLIVADDGDQLVAVVGGLAAPFLNNPAYTLGSELLWWVNEEHRNSGLGKQLITAIEDAAKTAGCDFWLMVSLEAVEPEKAGAVYERLGYRLIEHSYMKDL